MGKFDRDMSIIAQNAGSTAASIYNALLSSRGQDQTFDPDEYEAIRLFVFQGTLELAGAETVVEKFEGTTTPSTTPAVEHPDHPDTRHNPDSEAPYADTVVKFGKHRGKTIAKIDEEDRGWLEWCAGNSNNDFVKKATERYLAATG